MIGFSRWITTRAGAPRKERSSVAILFRIRTKDAFDGVIVNRHVIP
jgi:hypothetical protein